jgi:uncharacterized membrane protein
MLSKHRLEALIDGIFAVAMTLLVIELKVPDRAAIQAASDLAIAVARLIPTFIAWTISFFVLGIFWYGQHRLFHFVRGVDGTLTWLTIAYLSLASLMPFSSALAGEYARVLFSQVFYSTNMLLLSAVSLLMHRYVFRHQELVGAPMPPAFYRAARFRLLGLIVVALVAIGMAMLIPGTGNVAFMLMMPISIISGRLERRSVLM